MRRRLLVMAPMLACVTLAGCSGGAASRPSGPAGSPGNPQVFSCAEESFLAGPMPPMPEPGDLAVGPLVIISGKAVATGDPSGFGELGSYKIPFFVPRGTTVTVTIDPPARGHVVIDNPYARHGVTAATYRPCAAHGRVLRPGFRLHRRQDPGVRAAGGASRRPGARAARHALAVRELLRGVRGPRVDVTGRSPTGHQSEGKQVTACQLGCWPPPGGRAARACP